MPRETEPQSIQDISLEELHQMDRASGRTSLFGVTMMGIGFSGVIATAIIADNKHIPEPDVTITGLTTFSMLLMFGGAYIATRFETIKEEVISVARRRGLSVKNRMGNLAALYSIQDDQNNVAKPLNYLTRKLPFC